MENVSNIDGNQQQPVFLSCPVMTYERFAEQTGMRVGQIRSQVSRGNLPGRKVGRLTLVNAAKLLDCANVTPPVPVMTYERFSELSGMREPQVISQAGAGNLPTRYVGRLRLIDVVELTKQCLEQE